MQACPVNDGISYLLKSTYKQKVSKIDLHWLFNQNIARISDFSHLGLEEKEIQGLNIFLHYCLVTHAVAMSTVEAQCILLALCPATKN